MPMWPFEELVPSVAEPECWVFGLPEARGRLAAGRYVVHESYCIAPGCDCENVLLNVKGADGRSIATVNHSLVPGGFADIDEEDSFLDPLHPQSDAAEDALALIRELMSEGETTRRLERHRAIVRAIVTGHVPRAVDRVAADADRDPNSGWGPDLPITGTGTADRILESGLAQIGAQDPGRLPRECADPAVAWPVAVVPSVAAAVAAIGAHAGSAAAAPAVAIRMRGTTDRVPVQVTDEVDVVLAGRRVSVTLPPARDLYRGDRRPPDFADAPTTGYTGIFLTIERTARLFCDTTGIRVRDVEFQRIYDLLRRRPDATDPNPLHGALSAAIRLRMCLEPISRDEIDAVLRRLAKSARRFSDGPSSTNYRDIALAELP